MKTYYFESTEPLFIAPGNTASGLPYHASDLEKTAFNTLLQKIIDFVGQPVSMCWWPYRHGVEYASCDIQGLTEDNFLPLSIALCGRTELPNDISFGGFQMFDSVDAFHLIKAIQIRLGLTELITPQDEPGFVFGPKTSEK
jgi:hypothetical protein